MTRTPLLGLLLTCACGVADMAPLSNPDEASPTHLVEASDFDGALKYLVVASDEAGIVHFAGIQRVDGLPVFVLPNGRHVPLPGAQPGAEGLVMTVGPDRLLHTAWRTANEFYYARVDPNTHEGEARLMSELSVDGLNLAVAEDGRVALSFVRGLHSRTPQLKAGVLLGSLEGGFEDQAQFNPECCGDGWGSEGGWSVSHASTGFDGQGRLHLAYTWQGIDGTVVDYLRKQGEQWEFVTRLQADLQTGAPHLKVGEYDQRITFFDQAQGMLQSYVRAGRATEPRPLWPSTTFRSAQATYDAQGTLHVVAIEDRDEGERIVHIEGFDVDNSEIIAQARSPSERLSLVPGAGGMAIGPSGEFWLPYLRRSEGRGTQTTAALAVGRQGK